MNGFENFKEQLPNREKFCSYLTGNVKKECEHVVKVWNKIEIKVMKNYRNLYINCNFLLLAYVFNSSKIYGLFLSHYLRVPVLNRDAMINMTKAKIEVISETEVYLFLEEGIRGRVLTFLGDIVKPETSDSNSMDQNKNQNMLHT